MSTNDARKREFLKAAKAPDYVAMLLAAKAANDNGKAQTKVEARHA